MTLAWALTWPAAVSPWPNWKCKDKVGQELAGLPGSMGCVQGAAPSWRKGMAKSHIWDAATPCSRACPGKWAKKQLCRKGATSKTQTEPES